VGETEGEAEADPVAVAREIVLRSLTGRDQTRDELSRKLARRHVPGEAAEEVLERLSELGLIDDQAFARRWVDSRRARRGLSRQALRRELSNKGVDRDIVEEVTADLTQDEELTTAYEIARRRIRTLQELPPEVRARRLAGFLARRGFHGSVVAQVVRAMVVDHPIDDG
jgi:regulatory protein